jgi:hypothetical protein
VENSLFAKRKHFFFSGKRKHFRENVQRTACRTGKTSWPWAIQLRSRGHPAHQPMQPRRSNRAPETWPKFPHLLVPAVLFGRRRRRRRRRWGSTSTWCRRRVPKDLAPVHDCSMSNFCFHLTQAAYWLAWLASSIRIFSSSIIQYKIFGPILF